MIAVCHHYVYIQAVHLKIWNLSHECFRRLFSEKHMPQKNITTRIWNNIKLARMFISFYPVTREYGRERERGVTFT